MLSDLIVLLLTVIFVAAAFYPVAGFVYVASEVDAVWHREAQDELARRALARKLTQHLYNDEVRRAKARCRKRGSHVWVAVSSEGKPMSIGSAGIVVGYVCTCGAWRPV